MKPFCKFISWPLNICFNRLCVNTYIPLHIRVTYRSDCCPDIIILFQLSQSLLGSPITFYKHTHPDHKPKLQASCVPAQGSSPIRGEHPCSVPCLEAGPTTASVSIFTGYKTGFNLWFGHSRCPPHRKSCNIPPTHTSLRLHSRLLHKVYISHFITFQIRAASVDIAHILLHQSPVTSSRGCRAFSRAFKLAMYAVHDLPYLQTGKGSIFLTSPSLFLTSPPPQLSIYWKQ